MLAISAISFSSIGQLISLHAQQHTALTFPLTKSHLHQRQQPSSHSFFSRNQSCPSAAVFSDTTTPTLSSTLTRRDPAKLRKAAGGARRTAGQIHYSQSAPPPAAAPRSSAACSGIRSLGEEAAVPESYPSSPVSGLQT